jgi:GH25 family lysozyme M1 (1,4-beta-N-acetylmuramidase)
MYLGIDTASVAGNKAINWAAAKAAGCQYAIFRGTYNTWADPTWKLEADRARAQGVTVGAYLFPVMSVSAPSPQAQVAAFSQAVGPLSPSDLPPTLDVEFSDGIARTGRSRLELLAWIRAAVAALKATYGVPPMIYTSARIWDGTDPDSLDIDGLGVATPELLECPLWLARYPFRTGITAITQSSQIDAIALPPVPKAWIDGTNVWIHQYQGDARSFPGCTGAVDLNRFFDLRRGAKGERVRWIQRVLGIAADGDFGPATMQAVVKFQSAHQLIADGIVGPRTFARLCWMNGVDAVARSAA